MVVGMSMEAGIEVMGTKLGMMSYFNFDGQVVLVTVVGFREGNIVTQVKSEARVTSTRPAQSLSATFRSSASPPPPSGVPHPLRHHRRSGFRAQQRLCLFDGEGEGEKGIFKEGALVDVSGTTIGKGFQGGIKRYNFWRGPMSHGSKSHRALGSIGAGTTPGRVYPSKKMPGRMGGTKRKIRKLQIVKIDNELRVFLIKGALPGKPGNLLRIAPAKIVGVNIPKN